MIKQPAPLSASRLPHPGRRCPMCGERGHYGTSCTVPTSPICNKCKQTHYFALHCTSTATISRVCGGVLKKSLLVREMEFTLTLPTRTPAQISSDVQIETRKQRNAADRRSLSSIRIEAVNGEALILLFATTEEVGDDHILQCFCVGSVDVEVSPS
eukprot:GHVP01036409.1.p1 GENE.GHVP01036409.1~~GHVP01036409.1.p1  ORF type:complete len:156 (+),score=2.39 GHVP01036409.1:423-890(+)